MSNKDVFGMTDKLDVTLLEVMATRLEARGNHPFFAKMLQEYLDAMEINSAKLVLDMGCGTGIAARQIARREGFSGKVVGIDIGAYLIEAAPARAAEEGIADHVEFRTGYPGGVSIAMHGPER